MKIINFGSMNIDRVYRVEEFARPGQTVFAHSCGIFPGGKGLNQSVASARAGAKVLHAGLTGKDGLFLKELLEESGVDTEYLRVTDAESGQAVIEVDRMGQNRILVYGGTNQLLTEEYIDDVLNSAEPGDIVLLQNETNCVGTIIEKAYEKGLSVAFNPSPVPKRPYDLPLGLVKYFMVNEIEAAQLAGMEIPAGGEESAWEESRESVFGEILEALSARFPESIVIMTIGRDGVLCRSGNETFRHGSYHVPVKDTTAAGDTFSGYFLSAICRGADLPTALQEASAAAAIAVSGDGAAPSIPEYAQVQQFLLEQSGNAR